MPKITDPNANQKPRPARPTAEYAAKHNGTDPKPPSVTPEQVRENLNGPKK